MSRLLTVDEIDIVRRHTHDTHLLAAAGITVPRIVATLDAATARAEAAERDDLRAQATGAVEKAAGILRELHDIANRAGIPFGSAAERMKAAVEKAARADVDLAQARANLDALDAPAMLADLAALRADLDLLCSAAIDPSAEWSPAIAARRGALIDRTIDGPPLSITERAELARLEIMAERTMAVNRVDAHIAAVQAGIYAQAEVEALRAEVDALVADRKRTRACLHRAEHIITRYHAADLLSEGQAAQALDGDRVALRDRVLAHEEVLREEGRREAEKLTAVPVLAPDYDHGVAINTAASLGSAAVIAAEQADRAKGEARIAAREAAGVAQAKADAAWERVREHEGRGERVMARAERKALVRTTLRDRVIPNYAPGEGDPIAEWRLLCSALCDSVILDGDISQITAMSDDDLRAAVMQGMRPVVLRLIAPTRPS